MRNLTNAVSPAARVPVGILGFAKSFRYFAADIMIAHSIFALPFAASALLLAHLAPPNSRQGGLLLICMVTARTVAMGMNRVLDRDIDKANARTQMRQIPVGALATKHASLWILGAGALFVAAALALSPLAGILALPLLIILSAYSWMKRLTWLTHWYLGICLGLAPIGVEIALTGRASLPTLILGAAVAVWTAGFDILYALQDLTFDRGAGLFSIPSRFGPALAIWISRACFMVMVLLLISCGRLAQTGSIYYLGVGIVAALLVYEHVLVRDAKITGYSRNIGPAFFNTNAYVSVIFFCVVVLDRLWTL